MFELQCVVWSDGSSDAADTRLRALIPILARPTVHLIALDAAGDVLRWINVCKVGSRIALRARIVQQAVVT